jgi:UDP-N-acetyl-2-amino-2-deoxyglucuronate dehydrogenase
MAKQRVALIGLGMAVAPHAKSLLDLKDRVDVVAWSPSAQRREAFAKSYPFAFADGFDALLADPTINAVAILSPPNTHLDLVQKAAAAGKHILLEKPLEITTSRAQTLVDCTAQAGVTLGVVLQHRFRPAAERLKTIIDEGRLGALVNCSTSIRLWRPQSYYDEPGRGVRARDGGGVLITQGIHTLDLMLSLAGPIAEVTGYAMTSPVHRMETEDMVAAAVRYANGAIGVIDATTAAFPGLAERIDLVGGKGSASLAGTSLLVQWQDGTREEHGADGSAGGTGADPMAFPHHYHRSVWIDFLDAITQGRSPRVTGAEALKVHRLIDALIATAATGKPVSVSG